MGYLNAQAILLYRYYYFSILQIMILLLWKGFHNLSQIANLGSDRAVIWWFNATAMFFTITVSCPSDSVLVAACSEKIQRRELPSLLSAYITTFTFIASAVKSFSRLSAWERIFSLFHHPVKMHIPKGIKYLKSVKERK